MYSKCHIITLILVDKQNYFAGFVVPKTIKQD